MTLGWEQKVLLAPAGTSPFYRALREPGSSVSHEGKPAFSPEDALQVIDLFASHGAAITHGRIYLLTDEGPQGLETPGLPFEPIRVPGAWGCRRKDEEPWDTFVARSTRQAREHVGGLLASGLARGGAWVDLEWVLEDELTYRGIPSTVIAIDRELADSGEWPAATFAAQHADGIRVRWAGAARGSFYSSMWVDRNRVRELAEDASQRPQVRVLRASLVNDRTLLDVARMRGLRALELGHLRASSLEAITGLEELECLSVHAEGRGPDLRPLAALPHLKVLRLSGRALDRFADIRICTRLTGLHVFGGGPGATFAIDSLAPVSGLRQLRTLRLGLTRVRDRSLRPLAQLRSLHVLALGDRRFPVEELAWLAATVTWLDHDIRSPFASLADVGTALLKMCRKCGAKSRRATRGPRRQWLCPTCQPTKFAEYVASWELLVAAAVRRPHLSVKRFPRASP